MTLSMVHFQPLGVARCASFAARRSSVAFAAALVVLFATPAQVFGQAPTPTPLYLRCPVTGFDGRALVALTAVNPAVAGSQLAAVDQTDPRVLALQPREGGRLFDIGACDRAFSTPAPISLTLNGPKAIAAAQLGEGDNRIDLVVLGLGGILPLFSDGAGGFVPPMLPVPPTPTPAAQFTPYRAGDDPRALAIADFDRDNNNDIAVATGNGNSIEILFGTTSGGFEDAKSIQLLPESIFVSIVSADFDVNGAPDLAAITRSNLQVYRGEKQDRCENDSQCVCLARGENNNRTCFRAESAIQFMELFESSQISASLLSVGNFSRDGIPDLAVVTAGGQLHLLITELKDSTSPGELPLLSFSLRQTFDTAGAPKAIAVGNFNGDQYDDVAVAVSGSTRCPTRAATPGQTPEATPDPERTATPTPTPDPNPPRHCVLLYLSDPSGNLSEGPAFAVGANPVALVAAQLEPGSDRSRIGYERDDIVSLNKDANEGLTILLSGNPPPTPTVTVTNTPTITGPPTETPVPTETPTLEPQPPATPRPTNTCPPDQFCVQGDSCAVVAAEDRGFVPWPLIGLAALALLLRRRR
jgi:MYXO-CTERM domain-containing protein